MCVCVCLLYPTCWVGKYFIMFLNGPTIVSHTHHTHTHTRGGGLVFAYNQWLWPNVYFINTSGCNRDHATPPEIPSQLQSFPRSRVLWRSTACCTIDKSITIWQQKICVLCSAASQYFLSAVFKYTCRTLRQKPILVKSPDKITNLYNFLSNHRFL